MNLQIRKTATSITLALGLMGALLAAQPALPAQAATSTFPIEAHRGGAALNPENSMLAFRATLVRGDADIETDVQYTSDHVAFLNHDDKIVDISSSAASAAGMLPRNCDHDGLVIHKSTAAQVAAVRCAGQLLPRLSDLITLMQQNPTSKTKVNMEVKAFDDVSGYSGTAQSATSLRDYTTRTVNTMNAGMPGRFYISSFAWRTVAGTMKASYPTIPFQAIEHATGVSAAYTGADPYQVVRDAAGQGSDIFTLSVKYATVPLLDYIKAYGMTPMMYDITTEAQTRFAVANGVKAVCSNNPPLTRIWIDRMASQTAAIASRTLSAKTIVNETVSVGEVQYNRVINGSGLPSASTQAQMKGARMQVTITGKGKGTVVIYPRNARAADGVTIAIPNGTKAFTVTVAPGDNGEIRTVASVSSKVVIKVIGWSNVNY